MWAPRMPLDLGLVVGLNELTLSATETTVFELDGRGRQGRWCLAESCREAMQRDRDAGVGVSELAKKYGVSRVTIYKRTRSNGTDNRSSSRLIECEKVHGRALGHSAAMRPAAK